MLYECIVFYTLLVIFRYAHIPIDGELYCNKNVYQNQRYGGEAVMNRHMNVIWNRVCTAFLDWVIITLFLVHVFLSIT